MSLDDYAQFPSEILIREAEVHSDRKGFKSHTRIVITTMLFLKLVPLKPDPLSCIIYTIIAMVE